METTERKTYFLHALFLLFLCFSVGFIVKNNYNEPKNDFMSFSQNAIRARTTQETLDDMD